MIPLKDDNPVRRTPWVTLALIVACVGVYFFVQPVGRSTLASTSESRVADVRFTIDRAAIPQEVTSGHPLSAAQVDRTYGAGASTVVCRAGASVTAACAPGKNVYLAVLVSMFLHGSLLHIGGNMLFLWIFGNNIEDRMGRLAYLGFYLVGGVVATGAHIAVQPHSETPLVGASGAIAAVMGAYLVLYPNVRIRTIFIILLFWIRDVRAKWLLGFWLVSQFFIAPSEGVAWVAHVGGFAFGVLVGLAVRAIGGRGHTDAVPQVHPSGPYGSWR